MLFDTASEQCNIAEDATCADGATTRPTPTTTMVTSSNTETTQPTRATSDNPDATETDETSVPTTGSPTSSSTSASSFQTEGKTLYVSLVHEIWFFYFFAKKYRYFTVRGG